MIIDPKIKLREAAGEFYVMVQGAQTGTNSKVVAFNETSVYLWNKLVNRPFELTDVTHLLMQQYIVDEDTASTDAQCWIDALKQFDIIVNA